MKAATSKAMSKGAARLAPGSFAVVAGLLCVLLAFCARGSDADSEHSPRELYNDGTQKLHDGKLMDAEMVLQNAIASQDTRVQPPALYNLGEARFQDGQHEYTNAPEPGRMQAADDHALQNGANALSAADAALASNDLQAMVNAYMQGRGARRELKAATAAV